MRVLGYSSLATAAAVLMATGIAFFGTTRTSAAAEFKTAMENAAKAKNLVFTQTQKLSPKSPEMRTTVSVRDMQIRVDIHNPGMPGQPEIPSIKELPLAATILIDRQLEKSLQINYFAKTAQWEKVPERLDFPDLVAGFRHLIKAEGIKRVGEENVGTVNAKKYTMKTAEFIGGKGEFDVTVWIDANTDLPVKVTVVTSVNKTVDGKTVPTGDVSRLTFEDFRFDQKLPDDTFKMEPPKGYKTTTVERNPMDGTTTEKK